MIKTASNKQLVEKFMFHVPQSVMGTSFPPSVIKATQSEIETLRTQLAKANERIEKLTERCKPSKVIMIDGSGHYVSESVYKEIKQLRKEQEQC